MIDASDHVAILELLRRYNHAIDAGDDAAWAETFTPGGIFRHPARDWRGRDELRRFCRDRAKSLESAPLTKMRHWNDEIELTGSESGASASCRLAVIGDCRESGIPKIAAIGVYRDRLVLHEGNWCFAERELTLK